jgi:hypothetical protein
VATTQDYAPVAADIGHPLVCRATGTESGTLGGTTDVAASAASAPVVPRASLTITQFSSVVRGNIGESFANVSVTVTLKRPTGIANGTADVATATVMTDASGSWTATLAPENPATGPSHGFGASGDVLRINYVVGTSSATAVPPQADYRLDHVSFLGSTATISPDGSTITAPGVSNSCTPLSFVINGTTHASGASGSNCTFGPSPALDDQDHVQAADVSTFTNADQSVSTLTTMSDVGLVGVGSNEGASAGGLGPPTCTGDPVSTEIVCSNLSGASFAVQRNGGSPEALITTQVDSGPGQFARFSGSAFVPGLTAGDVVTLDETAPTVTTRHLTTLHEYTLRVDIGPDGLVSGDCQPNKLLSTTGGICPTAATFSGSQTVPSEFDDLSGGSTILNVPSFSNVIPANGDSIAGGAFTAYADLAAPVGNPAQVLAEVASLHLSIVPHAGGPPAFSQDMTKTSDAMGPFATANVTGLAQGRYFANWLLTDANGDTLASPTDSDLFAVQSAAGPQGPQGPRGPQGATGPQGPQGLQGPAGNSYVVRCKKKGKRYTCTVSLLTHGVHMVAVDITRHGKTVAFGSTLVRGHRTRLTLRTLRPLAHGWYVITIVETRGRAASVTRFRRRI